MYKQISKSDAVKRFERGETIYVLASKLNPNNPIWVHPAVMNLYDDSNQYTFDSFVNSYKYYNCNRECGMGVRFYII